MLATACLLGIVVSVLLLLARAGNGIHNPGRVLLVTAHPDDETIFFAPVATSLHSRGLEVFLLCLTNGATHIWAPLCCSLKDALASHPSSTSCISKLLASAIVWGPAFANLTVNDCSILTAGGAHGLGDLRQRELTEAAQQLQVRLVTEGHCDMHGNRYNHVHMPIGVLSTKLA